eukprot:m.174636 g.174636  ORF g.174636 m.174636 type:complete len:1486 (+) comp13861_c0_seq1:211-4668(+)
MWRALCQTGRCHAVDISRGYWVGRQLRPSCTPSPTAPRALAWGRAPSQRTVSSRSGNVPPTVHVADRPGTAVASVRTRGAVTRDLSAVAERTAVQDTGPARQGRSRSRSRAARTAGSNGSAVSSSSRRVGKTGKVESSARDGQERGSKRGGGRDRGQASQSASGRHRSNNQRPSTDAQPSSHKQGQQPHRQRSTARGAASRGGDQPGQVADRLRATVRKTDELSLRWKSRDGPPGSRAERAIITFKPTRRAADSIPSSLSALCEWYGGLGKVSVVGEGADAVAGAGRGLMRDAAATDALAAVSELQRHALGLAADAGAAVPANAPPATEGHASNKRRGSSKAAGVPVDVAKRANRVRNGLSINSAVQATVGAGQPSLLGLHVATTRLNFDGLTPELRRLRDVVGPSVEGVGFGYSKAEAQAMALIHVDSVLKATAGIDIATKCPGLSEADALKAQADRSSQLLDLVAFRKASLDVNRHRRGYLGSVSVPLRDAFAISRADNLLTASTTSPAPSVASGGHAAITAAEVALRERADLNLASIDHVRAQADDAGRRVIGVAVPRQHHRVRTEVDALVAAHTQATSDTSDPFPTVAPLAQRKATRGGRPMPELDYNEVNETLKTERAAQREASPEMEATRAQLPIAQLRSRLSSALDTSQVVVVSGGTGSGKTTQIPQYILDDAIEAGHGSKVNILVTQPRRIAAVSIARRVAQERGEDVGNSVGFSVRHQARRARPYGSIEYCTTGVVLNQLQMDPTLANVTHVIVDEVHERDISTDFLLVLLKSMLTTRPELKVLLMSATLDAAAISDYFGGAPLVEVPSAPRYPIEEVYLDDIFRQYPESHTSARNAVYDACLWEQQQLEHEVKALKRSAALSEGVPEEDDAVESVAQLSDEHARVVGELNPPPRKSPSRPSDRSVYVAAADLCAKLAVDLLEEAMQNGTDQPRGSILCFLPGMEHIRAVQRHLSTLPEYHRMKVIQLHSSVPFEEQQPVFEPAPDGQVKVILATNIAESSVTISDAVAVVDCGRVKELRYDAPRRMSVLDTVAASRASATQRKGRTGRVGPGVCYRMYTRPFESLMPDRSEPEMLRMELQKTCLQAKALVPAAPVAETLARAMDPPSDKLMNLACDRLQGLGAFAKGTEAEARGWSGEGLTYLGRRLAALPLEPVVGKMLLWGSVFQCVEPIAVAAACYSTGSPFLSLAARREEIMKHKFSFGADGDIATSITAFEEWERISREYGRREAGDWAYERSLRGNALQTIQSTKRQLLRDLSRMGFFSQREYEETPIGEPGPNYRSDSDALISALRFSGLSSNIAKRFYATDKNNAMHTTEAPHVTVHQGSMYNPQWGRHDRNIGRGRHHDMYAYSEMVMNGGIPALRETTPVRPIELLLFGGADLTSMRDGGYDTPDGVDQTDPLCGRLDHWTLAVGDHGDFAALSALRRLMHEVFERRVKLTRRPALTDVLDEWVLDTVVETLNGDRYREPDAENQ